MTRPHMRPDTVLSPLGGELRDWNLGARQTPHAGAFARALIIDLDDTLYPHEVFVQSGLMAAARHVEETKSVPAMDAFAVMTARRREQGGQEFQALCAHFGWDEQEVPGLVAVFRGHLPILRLPRASGQVLAQLRADGWRIVVLTNGLPLVQRGKVKALGLGPLVDAVIYAEEHASGGKPAAEAFRAAMNAVGLSASQCVCVGDDIACDIAGASAQGISTVWLDAHPIGRESAIAGHHRPPDGLTTMPDRTIASISELPSVLPQLARVTRDAA